MPPRREHVYQNHHLDSTRWDDFQTRSGDIVVSTPYKAGTTLVQTIVMNMLFPRGDMPGPVAALSPWLDKRFTPLADIEALLAEQTHRRCIKSHLPLDGLPYYDHVNYIMVGRDPRDIFMSLLNHWGNHTPAFYELLNGTPGLVGDPLPEFEDDVHKLWQDWITRGGFAWESEGYPYWSPLYHAASFWRYRHLHDIRLLHFNDLRADLGGEMRKLAQWLEIDVPEELWPGVVRACEFDTVKADPSKVVAPTTELAFKGGGDTFIHKGTNGRWKNVLTEAELQQYRDAMQRSLPADCARWLEHGGASA